MKDNIGTRLKQLRTKHGFSKEEMGEYLNMNPDQITGLEENSFALQSSTLNQLCLLYNCTPEYILDCDEKQFENEFTKELNENNVGLDTIANMNRIIRNLGELSNY